MLWYVWPVALWMSNWTKLQKADDQDHEEPHPLYIRLSNFSHAESTLQMCRQFGIRHFFVPPFCSHRSFSMVWLDVK